MNITEKEKEITITINIRYGVHMCTSIIHQIYSVIHAPMKWEFDPTMNSLVRNPVRTY